METYKRWKEKMLSVEKERFDSADILVHYLIRPLSIFASIPFAALRVKAMLITKTSLVFALLAFPLFACGHFWLGMFAFFIWDLLDFVDGNIARCNDETSSVGELWDALVGWIAMFFFFSGMGFIAYHNPGILFFYI